MMFTIVVAGRNDNYGGHFAERLLRSAAHNGARFRAAGLPFEYVFVEWNPISEAPLLSETFVRALPEARALVVAPAVHRAYSMNPSMRFYEMPAKNAGIRRARGEYTIVINADVLFDDALVDTIARASLHPHTFYRAHRIDVAPDLEWAAMKDPAQQLPSGEGACLPAYYLGAGGDFALASTSLWHQTTGFNETARFTTRAKDWQFFLTVAALGHPIEFIGNVYHLDHDSGFRHAPPGERDSSRAHFGGLWDYEFGVPARNRADWGLARCRARVHDVLPIETLDEAAPLFTPEDNDEDGRWQKWLTPSNEPDAASAFLLHAILAAGLRGTALCCRVERPQTAVALAGLAAVAARAHVAVFCDWHWPASIWMRPRELRPEPSPPTDGTLIVAERSGCWRAEIDTVDVTSEVLPSRRRVECPRFNPLFARRLLRALLRIRRAGHRRIAVYGSGGHTDELLAWGFPDDLELTSVIVSVPDRREHRGLPVIAARDVDAGAVDAVMLSSVTYEAEMLASLRELASPIPVFPLYLDWPAELWGAQP